MSGTCDFAKLSSGKYKCLKCGYLTPITHGKPPLKACRGTGKKFKDSGPLRVQRSEKEFPCIHRVSSVGTVSCGCSGSPIIYQCELKGLVMIQAIPFKERIINTADGPVPFEGHLKVCIMCDKRQEPNK